MADLTTETVQNDKSKLFAWGANSYGQLSTEDTEDRLKPSLVTPWCPKRIAAGGGHTCFLNDDQYWYACGSNSLGQLGIESTDNQNEQPTKITFSDHKKTQKIVCGWDFSFIIDSDGKLYSCGSNVYGQIAHGSEKLKNKPTVISDFHEHVTDASCGLRHSLVLTQTGDLYASGSAKKGQLGAPSLKTMNQVSSFKKVELKGCGKIIQVAAGAYHSSALTVEGEVLVWGDNKHGQLALNPADVTRASEPIKVAQHCFNHRRVTCMASGWTHMLAQTDDGSVYSWGRNNYSQLGRCTDDTHTTFSPSIMTSFPAPPSQLAVGSEHNLAIINGKVYSWGWNEHGMCGTGDESDVTLPQPIKSLQHLTCSHVACGAGHSFAVCS